VWKGEGVTRKKNLKRPGGLNYLIIYIIRDNTIYLYYIYTVLVVGDGRQGTRYLFYNFSEIVAYLRTPTIFLSRTHGMSKFLFVPVIVESMGKFLLLTPPLPKLKIKALLLLQKIMSRARNYTHKNGEICLHLIFMHLYYHWNTKNMLQKKYILNLIIIV